MILLILPLTPALMIMVITAVAVYMLMCLHFQAVSDKVKSPDKKGSDTFKLGSQGKGNSVTAYRE